MNLFQRIFRRKERPPRGVIIIDGINADQLDELARLWSAQHSFDGKVHWGRTYTREQAQQILDDLTALLKELGSEV